MAHTSVKITSNSSDYQASMKSCAQATKVLAAEYGTAATRAKEFGTVTDQLKVKAEGLTEKIKVQKQIVDLNAGQQEKLTQKLSSQKTEQEALKKKIDDTKSAYEKSAEETGKNSEQSKALKEELDKLEQEYTKNESAIGKTETALANQTVKTEKSKTALIKMESELKKTNSELRNHGVDVFTGALDKAGEKIQNFGSKMTVVSAGIAGIGAASIKSFKELDEGYDTIVTKTGATGEALDDLTASADNVFGSMPADMATVGEAIGEVNTRFHTTGEELEDTSKLFIQFAEINGTQVTSSVDQVDKIMQAWNVDSSQTGNVLGLLTAKAQETGISVDTLESNVLDNNAAFKEMGLSLPQAINLMAQFDANGVDTTQALAGFKKALQNATAEGKSMDQALEETIGSIKDAKTDTEALQIATELFGKKGAAEMATAIRENRIDLTDLSSSMTQYGSTVETTYNATLDPIDQAKVASNNMKLALSSLATTAQIAAAPMIDKVTTKIKELTTGFANLSPKQQETILKVGLVVAAIGPLAVGFGKVVTGISNTVKAGQSFVNGAASLIAKITGKTAATAAETAATAASTTATTAGTAATVAQTTATTAATTATTALGVAMRVLQTVGIIALITGIVAGIVLLVKNFDKVKETVSNLWGHIKNVFSGIKDTITGAFTKAKEAVTEKLSAMKNAIANSKIGQAAQTAFSAIKSTASNVMSAAHATIKEKLGNIKTAYEEHGGGIKGVVAAGMEGVKGYFTAGLTFVDNLTGGKLSAIKEKFTGKISEIKSKVSEGWSNMKETVKNKMTEWKDTASEKLTSLKEKFTSKTSEIKSKWQADFTDIKDKATNLMENAKTNVKTKLDNMKTAYQEAGGGIKGVSAAAFSGIKDNISNVMSGINTLTGGKLDSIKNAFQSKLASAKSSASSAMSGIREAFSSKMEGARSVVSGALEKVKNAFKFKWNLPELKLPHISVSGGKAPYGIAGKGSLPKFNIEWYKNGGIMTNPTVFGVRGDTIMMGGEAGDEAILPLAQFYTTLNKILDRKLDTIKMQNVVYVTAHTYIDGDEVASRTVSKVDEALVNDERKRR